MNNTKLKFITSWQLLAFALSILIILFLIFPKNSLLKTIEQENQQDLVSQLYLQQLLRYYLPYNDQDKMLTTSNIIAMDQASKYNLLDFCLMDFQSTQNWKALFLCFKLLNANTVSIKKGQTKQNNLFLVNKYYDVMQNGPYTSSETSSLAKDLIGLDMPQKAFNLFVTTIDKSPEQPATFYALAAQTGAWVEQYQKSAQYYFEADHRSNNIADKRFYFKKGVLIIQASGNIDKTMQMAQENLQELNEDPDTLTFLSEVALKANRTDLADQYLARVLKLKISHGTNVNEY